MSPDRCDDPDCRRHYPKVPTTADLLDFYDRVDELYDRERAKGDDDVSKPSRLD